MQQAAKVEDITADSPGVPYGPALVVLGFILACIAGVASVYLVFRTQDATSWVVHTTSVRQQAESLLENVENADSSERGYLLSGNRAYLGTYVASRDAAPRTFATLKALTADNPLQQARLAGMKPILAAKREALDRAIAFAQAGRNADALNDFQKTSRLNLTVQLRARINAMLATEQQLLDSRQVVADNLRRWLLVVISVSILAALALVAILAQSMLRAVETIRQRTLSLVTETRLRKESEETLRQTQKIEAVGQLAGGIAHDFNNLLTIILGNLDLMQRRLENASPGQTVGELMPRLSKSLELAQQGGRSAAQLTQRLLAFSRRQALAPSVIDLNRLVSGMSDLLRRTIGETVNVETALAGGLWPTLADANQIEGALINLCINARDAMSKGGKLTIETANTFLDEAYASQFGDVTPGQYVLLAVTDTGTGIPPDVLPFVFEPFFTTRQQGEGSGLGLAMVHGFVKQTGGHIRIYSEPGEGTTVKIYLPRLVGVDEVPSAPAAKPADTVSMPRARDGEAVLIVEDNDAVREYARTSLEELGYHVVEAVNADDAIRLLKDVGRVDLLFTDVVMPGKSGRELANEAAKIRPDLAVLFTTGYSRNAIVHHGRLDADVQLLGKPYTQNALARKVRELLDGTR